VENNIASYIDDVYFNPDVKFQMKEMEYMNKWKNIFEKDNRLCFEEKS
jgi:hypothetical protein